MDIPNQKTTIGNLFAGKRKFAVPSFQRAYSWQVGNGDQVGQFLRDIREQGTGKQYYLGHFLFECASGSDVLQVVDGQQRLTTTVVFMSCLISECEKRGFKRLGEVDVEEISETYLEHRGQKFQTVKEDAAFFLQRIIKRDASATRTTARKSEGCLKAAADFFSTELAAASADELAVWYQVLSDAIITTYTIEGGDTQAMSAQIFSFQNDRGKGLTTLEKVKAWMIYQAYRNAEPENTSYLISVLEVKFSEIYGLTECLQNTSEDVVLGWHRQAFIDGWDDGALDAVKRSFDKAKDKIEWLLEFSARLAQTFRYVYELEQTAERWDGLIADICCLGKASAMPLLIKLRHFAPPPEASQQALALIENILFKLTFQNAGYRTNKLAQFARNYTGTNFESNLLPDLKRAAQYGFQGYWDFCGSCLRYFTENRNHYISELKYILYKYENYLRANRGEQPLDISACRAIFCGNQRVENTLDHITPGEPDFTEYTDAFKRDYLCNLGNLSLLTWSKNASKNNHDPTLPEIRKKYDTPYFSQKEIFQVLCQGRWKEAEIEDRRRRIVAFVIEHWHLGEPESFQGAAT